MGVIITSDSQGDVVMPPRILELGIEGRRGGVVLARLQTVDRSTVRHTTIRVGADRRFGETSTFLLLRSTNACARIDVRITEVGVAGARVAGARFGRPRVGRFFSEGVLAVLVGLAVVGLQADGAGGNARSERTYLAGIATMVSARHGRLAARAAGTDSAILTWLSRNAGAGTVDGNNIGVRSVNTCVTGRTVVTGVTGVSAAGATGVRGGTAALIGAAGSHDKGRGKTTKDQRSTKQGRAKTHGRPPRIHRTPKGRAMLQ